MESTDLKSNELITHAYGTHQRAIFLYIYYKVSCKNEAEDLTQDVFLRLMEYKQLICEATIKCFLFTIARNLVNDYLRRFYKKQEITSYMYDIAPLYTSDSESEVIANDLLNCEKQKLNLLPLQRRTVYIMSRFESKTISEISTELSLSERTVESHLFAGRKEVRAYMKMCI